MLNKPRSRSVEMLRSIYGIIHSSAVQLLKGGILCAGFEYCHLLNNASNCQRYI